MPTRILDLLINIAATVICSICVAIYTNWNAVLHVPVPLAASLVVGASLVVAAVMVYRGRG
jgi:hypothetical protein